MQVGEIKVLNFKQKARLEPYTNLKTYQKKQKQSINSTKIFMSFWSTPFKEIQEKVYVTDWTDKTEEGYKQQKNQFTQFSEPTTPWFCCFETSNKIFEKKTIFGIYYFRIFWEQFFQSFLH